MALSVCPSLIVITSTRRCSKYFYSSHHHATRTSSSNVMQLRALSTFHSNCTRYSCMLSRPVGASAGQLSRRNPE